MFIRRSPCLPQRANITVIVEAVITTSTKASEQCDQMARVFVNKFGRLQQFKFAN